MRGLALFLCVLLVCTCYCSAVDCEHGGTWNATVNECQGCLGAWKGRDNLGFRFNASTQDNTTGSTVQLKEMLCGTNHVWMPETITGDAALLPGSYLSVGQRLVDSSQTFFAVLMPSGDVALYHRMLSVATLVWHSDTAAAAANSTDIRLVLSSPSGELALVGTQAGRQVIIKVISDTPEQASVARVTPDGRLALFASDGTQVWTTPAAQPAQECLDVGNVLFTASNSTENATAWYAVLNEHVNDTSYVSTAPSQTWTASFWTISSPNGTNTSTSLYASRLCMDGWCDTRYTADLVWDKPCTHWDNSVPYDVLASQQDAFFAAGQARLHAPSALCTSVRECPGQGVNGWTGQPASLRVTMDAASNTSVGPLVVPSNLRAVLNPNIKALCDAELLLLAPSMSHVRGAVSKLLADNTARGGFLGHSLYDIYKSHFLNDDALTIVESRFESYMLELEGPQQLAPEFVSALLAAPPDIDTELSQDLWRRLLSQFGTHYVTTVRSGGMVTQQTSWESWLTVNFSLAELADLAASDFESSLSLCPVPPKTDDVYQAHRTLQQAVYGGNTSYTQDPHAWMTSLLTFPASIVRQFADISTLLQEQSLQAINATLHLASQWYLASEQSAYVQSFFCPVCTNNGTCTGGQDVCTCPSGYLGNDCSYQQPAPSDDQV